MYKIIETKCEYGENPVGLDCENPRLFWKLSSDGADQKFYRVIVSSSEENAGKGIGDLFDTGEIVSSEAFYTEYRGKKLLSRQKCFWRVWSGSETERAASGINAFEMGLLRASDWKGCWMGMPVKNQGGTSLYRKAIRLKEKPVSNAKAYVCGIGYHETFFNGKKVGSAVLSPSLSDYNARVFYRAYDLSPLLQRGENVFGVEVGHGWYGAKKVLVQIYVDYADGETEEYHSSVNGGWWVAGSPTLDNSVYDGEVYDARLEDKIPRNWASAEYRPAWENGWMFTIYAAPPSGKLQAERMEPIRVTGIFEAASLTDKGDGVKIADIGRNIAGWARIRVRGRRGARVTLKYGERLTADGFVNRCNLRSARASDTYVLKGEGEEEYAPRFTYHGFQYIQIEISGECELLSVRGEHVHNDLRAAGEFSCSDEDLNRLHANAVITELNNQHGILTDCPQRDERFGWLNDLSARLYQTVYNCGMERFFPKFTADVADTGTKEGAIGDTAPYYTGGRPADPVCVAYLLMPVFSYLYYGDRRCAEEAYEGCRAWTEYLLSRSHDGIMDYSYYGDWVEPDAAKVHTDNIYVSTVCLFWHLSLMKKLSEIVGKKEEEKEYGKKVESVAAAINEKYFDAEKCRYAGGTQTSDSMALTLGIVPEKYRKRVAENVANDIAAHGYHSTCGNVGYRHLFYALGEYGYADAALRMLKNKEYPGWGYMLANGATSVWERWESEMSDEMDSFDHPMFGSYDAFFYAFLGGIRIDENAFACDKITVEPVCAEGVDRVFASFDTVRGKIVSEWKRQDKEVNYHIEIPPCVTAKITLGGETYIRGCGVYDFCETEKGFAAPSADIRGRIFSKN